MAIRKIYASSQAAAKRSAKRIYKQVKIDLHKDYEKDVIEKLDVVPNKRKYLINLIRQDIARDHDENI